MTTAEPIKCIVAGDRVCAYCRQPFTPRRAWGAFCGDRCRNAFEQDIGMRGAVKRINKLATGTVSITVHLKGPAAERAINLEIGDGVRLVKNPAEAGE